MNIENKDPYECASCGTVNAWNQPVCRTCGAARSDKQTISEELPAPEDKEAHTLPAREEETSPPIQAELRESVLRRRWNAFWIFLGIAVHVVFIHLGVFSIIKVFIEPDPQLKTTIEKTLEAAQSGDAEKVAFLENLPSDVQSKLSSIRAILIFLLLAAPLLIGAATGYFSGSVLEGAASMGLSAVLIPVLNGAAEFAILWGPVNAGLGALGAYIGYRLARRIRPGTAAVKS